MAEEMQQANLSADADAVIPRLKLSESGTTVFTISNKQILEESLIYYSNSLNLSK